MVGVKVGGERPLDTHKWIQPSVTCLSLPPSLPPSFSSSFSSHPSQPESSLSLSLSLLSSFLSPTPFFKLASSSFLHFLLRISVLHFLSFSFLLFTNSAWVTILNVNFVRQVHSNYRPARNLSTATPHTLHAPQVMPSPACVQMQREKRENLWNPHHHHHRRRHHPY